MTAGHALDLAAFQQAVGSLGAIAVPRRTPMLHEIWLRACAEALDPLGRFEVITVGTAASPTAGAGFVRRGVPTRLSLLGAEALWEPNDVLYRDAASAEDLARTLIARGLPMRFGHFPAESPFLAALKGMARGKAVLIADAVAGSPYLPLDQSWREPLGKFSPRSQRDLRRKRRKADALGAVTFEIIEPGSDQVDGLLDEAMAVEASSWKGRSRTALAHDETLRTFFRVYARMANDEGILRFAFMRIDGRAVAVQIGLVTDGAYWQLKIGYDEQYRDCSPGSHLMLALVEHSATIGLDSFEFLGKSAPWTRQWTEEEHPNVRLRVYPYTLHGGVALLSDAVAVTVRRGRSWLRARLTRS